MDRARECFTDTKERSFFDRFFFGEAKDLMVDQLRVGGFVSGRGSRGQ
jgi:hypothetical protein